MRVPETPIGRRYRLGVCRGKTKTGSLKPPRCLVNSPCATCIKEDEININMASNVRIRNHRGIPYVESTNSLR
jgi:hypothetical protein